MAAAHQKPEAIQPSARMLSTALSLAGDLLLSDQCGLEPRLGSVYLRPLTIVGFLTATTAFATAPRLASCITSAPLVQAPIEASRLSREDLLGKSIAYDAA
jgi:hypothetical protein